MTASRPALGEQASPLPLADDLREADERDLPSRTDPLVRELSSVIGGPVGRHAVIGRARFFTPLRVLLALAIAFLCLGWLAKAPCIQQAPVGQDGSIGLDWRGDRQFVALCYSDTVPLYGAEGLDKGAFPYKYSWTDHSGSTEQTRYMEYPVITGLYQYVSAQIANGWLRTGLPPRAIPVAVYFCVVAFGLALAWLVTIWATALLAGGRRVWDVAIIACSPLVIVQAFTNFDMLSTAFTAVGLLAWARRYPVLAGVLLGIGTATKLYPVFLLGVLLVLCIRAGKLRMWTRAAIAAAVTWVAINVPIIIVSWHGWAEFFRLNSSRDADPDSIYNVIKSFSGWKGFPTTSSGQPLILNLVSVGLFILICAGLAYVALTAPRRPRVAQLAFLVVAAFLLTNKVWSPQYSLWLVPLAALALPHTRILLSWMAIDAVLWFPRMMYYLGEDHKGLPVQWFTATVIVRDTAVVILCALILRQIYRPGTDLVRRDGVDDPVGGVLDNAPDHVSWPHRPAFGRRSPDTASMRASAEPAAATF